MIIYTLQDYLRNCSTIEARIVALEAVIDELIISLSTAATTGQYQEYWLDDGQSKIKMTYRSPQQISAAISSIEMQIERYRSKLSGGRVSRLTPGDNFIGNGCNR